MYPFRPNKLFRLLAGNRVGCLYLNWHYNRMSYQDRVKTHANFSGVTDIYFALATWTIRRPSGTSIVFPTALPEQLFTVVGYDADMKNAYDRVLRFTKVSAFVDVGANFGTHCAHFLAKGIPVWAIEPSQECCDFLHRMKSLWPAAAPRFEYNQQGAEELVSGMHVFNVAAGRYDGTTRLYAPKGRSWLGITGDNPVDAMKAKQQSDDLPRFTIEELEGCGQVPESRLDSLLIDALHMPKNGSRIVLKIDVEGKELSVLNGAESFLSLYRPVVFFESFRQSDPKMRRRLYTFFSDHGYAVETLYGMHLGQDAFVLHSGYNFIAFPK